MKKIVLSLLTSVVAATTSFGQEQPKAMKIDARKLLAFGIKLGANLSNVYDTKGDQFQADAKLGFATGGFISIPIGTYIGIQPELLFSQKGFRATGGSGLSYYSITRTTNYIDVPVFFAFKPAEMLTILAGPQYSYLVRQTDVFANGSTSILQEKEFENDNVRRNMLCFVTGVDLNFNHFVLGARVGWDVQSNNGDGTSSTPRYKNVWYQATIGYRLF